MRLRLEEVTVRFGGIVAVNRFSLSLGDGEIVALVGPNGAGKSTVVNTATGYIRPTAGKVWLDDQDLTGLKPHAINARGLARTFQLVRIFPQLTALENVMVGLHRSARTLAKAQQEAEALLEFVGLGGSKHTRAGQMTLARQKHLELVRALATRPRVLFIDELMTGLTYAELEEMIQLLRRIRDQGISILFIEHIMEAVKALADRVVVLNYGSKIAEGSPEAVARDPEVITAYLGGDAEDA